MMNLGIMMIFSIRFFFIQLLRESKNIHFLYHLCYSKQLLKIEIIPFLLLAFLFLYLSSLQHLSMKLFLHSEL